MFGYVVINQGELKFNEYEIYQSYYCGLCHELSQKYGMLGRLSLNYDMTFLLILLSALYEPESMTTAKRCLIHPVHKKMITTSPLTEYIADMNVLLACEKCKDDWKDDKKLTSRIVGGMLERKESDRIVDKKSIIAGLLKELHEFEKRNSQELDAAAGVFGKMMACIVTYRQDVWEPILARFGFYLGKFIYLMDAYNDIEDDIKSGNYNPWKSRVEYLQTRSGQDPNQPLWQDAFRQECKQVLTMMLSAGCQEFEMLPITENVGILRNILYSGIWSGFERPIKRAKK
ncbi:MAG: DUF5685 family protein [Lachnospiraceae bacterium]|jgi:hypothetical protein|nr:DUF5685 family protein [Lachnospiraceae bacterium]